MKFKVTNVKSKPVAPRFPLLARWTAADNNLIVLFDSPTRGIALIDEEHKRVRCQQWDSVDSGNWTILESGTTITIE